MSDKHASAAWHAYGLALATFDSKQQTEDPFEREVYARTTAAKVWDEIKQKEAVTPNRDLDALASVTTAGFMREYVWYYLASPDWHRPDDLRLSEFLEWKDDHLQSHTPVLDPGGCVGKDK